MQWLLKHIETAKKLIENYKGDMPLQFALKNYFSANKKHGSRDRKIITHLCYTYFRLGKALSDLPFEERIRIALFLCEDDLKNWQILFSEKLLQLHSALMEKRIEAIKAAYPQFFIEDIFPFLDKTGIENKTAFAVSMLSQPYTFLRIRPGGQNKVVSALEKNNITYTSVNENAIAVEQGFRLDDILKINKDAVIQDVSSQRVSDFFPERESIESVWDCCAASGGKSILAYDYFSGKIQLTVSDVRKSILANLKQRLRQADVSVEKIFQADLTKPIDMNKKFDLIICDAPCSGSGTWARTPEQISFFTENRIEDFEHLQKQIVENIIHHTKENGWLLYITCSVFTKENEEMVAWIQSSYKDFVLVKTDYIAGYHQRADTMFAALFKKEIK